MGDGASGRSPRPCNFRPCVSPRRRVGDWTGVPSMSWTYGTRVHARCAANAHRCYSHSPPVCRRCAQRLCAKPAESGCPHRKATTPVLLRREKRKARLPVDLLACRSGTADEECLANGSSRGPEYGAPRRWRSASSEVVYSPGSCTPSYPNRCVNLQINASACRRASVMDTTSV